MRRVNAIISALIMLLFILHGIYGVLQMAGLYAGGTFVSTMLAHLLLTLLGLHVMIGTILTVRSIKNARRAGVLYIKENKRFITVRLSGFALMFLICAHVVQFMGAEGDSYRLRLFDTKSLILSLILVLAIAVHVICNVNPLLISLGLKRLRPFATDILLVLSVICLFSGIGFIIYFIRWLF